MGTFQEFKIIVPRGKRTAFVLANNLPARRLNSEQFPGFDFEIETWQATFDDRDPISQIKIIYEP